MTRLLSGEIPVVVEPIQRGEQRQPGLPADVDDDEFQPRERARHEGGGGQVEVLPAGPVVMHAVDQLPAAERDGGEVAGHAPCGAVEPAGAEEGAVPGLVQQDEPLEQGDRQEELAEQPNGPGVRSG